MTKRFSAAVRHQLGFYVYLYIDPIDDSVFYVGKGRANRAFSHLKTSSDSQKCERIARIRKAGQEPKIEILVHGLKDERTALKIESAVIDLLGAENLTNLVRGYRSRTHGRMTLEQICAIYATKPAVIEEPSLLIRVNKLYRHTMTPSELYDVTRGYWKVGPDRDKVQLAMAVYARVIREVYVVEKWFPAGTTFTTRTDKDRYDSSRWEFVGRIANDSLRKKYVNLSVAHLFSASAQNPIQYAGLE